MPGRTGSTGTVTRTPPAEAPMAHAPNGWHRPQTHNKIRCEGKVVELASLTRDPNNARLHPERNLDAIKDSLALYGQLEPLVVREQDMMIAAGNGRHRAMVEMGWTECAVTVQPMTDAEFCGFALADNRTAELARWDAEVVARIDRLLQDSGQPMVGFSMEDLTLIRQADWSSITSQDGGGDEFLVRSRENLPERAAPGNLWIIEGDGLEHRLMVGDAESPEDVAKLFGGDKPFIMVTDPPYGHSYETTWRHAAGLIESSRVGLVQNDDRADWSNAWRLFPGNVVYTWCASLKVADTQKSLIDCDFTPRSQVIWVKQQIVIGRGHYHWQHEPCWYAVRNGATANWSGDRKQSTVWQIDNPLKSGEIQTAHGTQKPLECMARPIRNHGKAGDIVYDPFLGSGTTIIAAHRLQRRCFGLEIDPYYADVILARCEAEGLTCRKANEKTRPTGRVVLGARRR